MFYRGSSAVEYRTRNREREPGFESHFATVSKFGHFRSLLDAPVDSAIYSGGHVSDLVFARDCGMARMLHREAEFVSE